MDDTRDRGRTTGLDSTDLEDAFDVDFEDGLPETVDRAAVRRMRLVATFLDESLRIPGTNYRIGADPIIGVVPVAGDLVGAALSMYIVLEANRLGVSYTTLMKMLANVSIDVAGGTIPYVGGVFDAVWKANKRNVELLVEDISAGEDVTNVDIE